MPCYNGRDYIAFALDSARRQTFTPWQIIVVDDGSTDGSGAHVRDYARRHPHANIRVIEQTNAGEAAARNTGIHEAEGAWVAMLDADDWWEPTKLEKQLAAAAEAGLQCVMVHTGVTHHYPDGMHVPMDLRTPARRTGWCTAALLEEGSIGHPSILVRRDALRGIGGYDTSFKQACDIDLYFRLSAAGTFAFVAEHLLHYRIHSGQMSRRVVEQVQAHHRAIHKFFLARTDIARQIGRNRIRTAMANHVAVKLKSLYWRRQFDQFRALLNYADDNDLQSPEIQQWRRRRHYPSWMIWVKDHLPPAGSPA